MPTARKNENPATARPSWARTRLMIAETSPIENSRPMIAPITRGDALALTGCFHARQLAATSTLLRVRPARTMPKRPASVAIQRVLFGWLRAVLICDARLPVMPGVLDLLVADDRREEPQDADGEEQQGDEEQEQAEGDGAADDGAGALAGRAGRRAARGRGRDGPGDARAAVRCAAGSLSAAARAPAVSAFIPVGRRVRFVRSMLAPSGT